MSTLNIGVSGLNAASIGLATTSHNIANASTPGYNRQVIVQATNTPVLTGSGFIGQGTNVETVKRVYDQYLSQQVLTAQTGASEMDGYYQQISQIDNILGDSSAGLSSAMSDFFNGIQSVTSDPSSISARQSMLSTAQSLVARFQSLNGRMAEIRDGVNSQITSEAASISSYASQIADVNRQILLSQAGSPTQQPNDLLDQRDQLIADLNKEVQVSTVTQSDGTMSVFFGNGQPLVVGTDAYSLTSGPAASDSGKIVVKLKAPGGTTMEIPESQITGGTLGGLISFRNDSLDSAQNALGRIAISLTQTFNAQHELGQDLTGALGGAFFSVGNPAVLASSLNSTPALPALPASISASFSASAASQLTTSDYRLSYSGGTYTLTRLSDNQSWTGGSAAAVATAANQGFDLSLTGTIANGDSFKIEPTRTGASSISVAITDARNIAAAAPMTTAAALANTGTGSISAGAVTSVANLPVVGTPITLTYSSATGSFSGFPVGSTVSVTPQGGTATLYTIAAATDPVTYVTGATISFNGMSVVISGSPSDKDKFVIQRNVNGVSDNRNAVALGALQAAHTMAGGTASYVDAYAQLVSDIGNKTREVKALGASQQALADSAVATQQSMSGVNLDEEGANLIRYQQAYQASAKMIDIASKLFDSILALG
jgi:flagellar hook-associated protein 1 FlgK